MRRVPQPGLVPQLLSAPRRWCRSSLVPSSPSPAPHAPAHMHISLVSPVHCSKGKLTQQALSCHHQPRHIPAGMAYHLKTSSCIFMLRRSRSSLCKRVGVKLRQPQVQLCLPTLTMVLGKSCHPTASTLPPEKWEIRLFSCLCCKDYCLG